MKAKQITLCGMFSALIAIGAFLKIDIPLPAYTMHFTLQWLFVMMAAFLLGASRGGLSVCVYLMMGLVGLPIFAAGGGLSYIFRPGFGFLLGFAFAAFAMGLLSERAKKFTMLTTVPIATLGLVIYYAVGAVYFYFIKNLYAGQAMAFNVIVVQYCLITIVPDFILCLCACALCGRLKPVVSKFTA